MSFLDYVRQTFDAARQKGTNEYALKSFLTFMSGIDEESVGPALLTSWIASLFLKGRTAATVKRYVCRLHVEYLGWLADLSPQPPAPDPFDGLLELAVPANEARPKEPRQNLSLVRRLVTPDTYKGEIGKWKAVFFYLLYNPDVTIEDVARLSFGETPQYCPQTVEIVESMDSSRGRRYVFPLDQPDKRLPGMVRDITEKAGGVAESVGMRFDKGFSRDRITAMWICAALNAGVSPGAVRAMVADAPDEYRALSLVAPATLSAKERQDAICRVANRINDMTTRWYVANMRDRITPAIVKDSVRETFPALFPRMSFFYPVRQVWRIDRKKKKVKVDVPYIPGLLFIKVRSDMVRKVMGCIRDVAWGYRYLNTPDSPYSVISQRAMAEFQTAIGEYTEDIRMELVTETGPFAVRDKVTLRGDSVDGSEGEIVAIKKKDGVTTYSVRLTSDTTFNWTVKVTDPLRLIRL